MTSLLERYSGVWIFLAGVLGVTAFAPFCLFPLAVLSLAALAWRWQHDTPKQALGHGLLFGLGFFGAGVSWVYVSLNTYGHLSMPVAVPVTLLLVLFLASYVMLLGYCLRRYLAGSPWLSLVVAFPAGWVVAEWLRGWLFSGFPWLNVGNSQVDSPLGGFAPLLGIYGTGYAVALSAGLLAALPGGHRRGAAVALLAAAWTGGYLLDRVEWTRPYDETLDVALVQGNISQDLKWAPENLLSTLSLYSGLTFGRAGLDVIVWPETAIPAFYDQVQENFIPYLERRLSKTGASLLTGIPVLDRTDWQYYNGVISLGGEGNPRGFYYKHHLVPYGEYLPLRSLIGDSLDALAVPNSDFSRGGPDQMPLLAAGYPVATSICFEVVFAEEIIRPMPEAALMVNVSNDAWFGDSLAPHQHLEMARMRAKEAGRPMLRATNTGISAIIDHRGDLVTSSPQFEQAVVTGSISPRKGATPYAQFGNIPAISFSILCLLAGLVRVRRSKA